MRKLATALASLPDSEEGHRIEMAADELKERLRRLAAHLLPLGYALLILADHGQHDIIPTPECNMSGSHGTDSDEDCQVPCTWVVAKDSQA